MTDKPNDHRSVPLDTEPEWELTPEPEPMLGPPLDLSPLPRSLCRLAGRDLGEIRDVVDRNRGVMLGAGIVATTASATTAVAIFASESGFPTETAVPIAALAGIGIGLFDRVLSSTPAPRRFLKRLVKVLPRLFVIAGFSIGFSQFIELRPFQDAIRNQVEENRIDEAAAAAQAVRIGAPQVDAITALTAEKTQLGAAVDAATARRDAAQAAVDDEARFGAGVRAAGCGEICGRKLETLDAAIVALNDAVARQTTRGAEIDAAIANLRVQIDAAADAAYENVRNDPPTVGDKLAALDEIARDDASVLRVRLLIAAILLVIDAGPLLLKLAPQDGHDRRLIANDEQARQREAEVGAEQSQITRSQLGAWRHSQEARSRLARTLADEEAAATVDDVRRVRELAAKRRKAEHEGESEQIELDAAAASMARVRRYYEATESDRAYLVAQGVLDHFEPVVSSRPPKHAAPELTVGRGRRR